jgi:hypothetical protein
MQVVDNVLVPTSGQKVNWGDLGRDKIVVYCAFPSSNLQLLKVYF